MGQPSCPLEDWACIGGTCQSPCQSDDECRDEVLGDLGYACVDGYCRR